MPIVYGFTALIGAAAMALLTILTGSAAILPVLASATIGATMAPLGAAILVFLSGDRDDPGRRSTLDDAP